MIQIGNVPEPLHRKLKARAAMAGTWLSGYPREQITAQGSVSTPQELTARLERLEPIKPREDVVEALQRARDVR